MSRLRFDRVYFDVDSTLVALEGIDELAKMRGVDVAALTEQAMRGELPLEAVYGRRLALVRPTVADVARLGALYVKRLVPGARATIAALHRRGVEVFVVSGALRPALLPLLDRLAVPGQRVFAVDLRFDARGRYAGFDERSPLARADGKREVVAALGDPRRRTAFVGEGATDLAAASAVDAFFAFTGVCVRPAVVAGATAAAHNFAGLRRLLGLEVSA